MRISDWSSDVCSSDLPLSRRWRLPISPYQIFLCEWRHWMIVEGLSRRLREPCVALETSTYLPAGRGRMTSRGPDAAAERAKQIVVTMGFALPRSEEHTSELQSLMRISYAVFSLQKKIIQQIHTFIRLSTYVKNSNKQDTIITVCIHDY